MQWENVMLHDAHDLGGFTFQTILYDNGDIVFAYKHIPLSIEQIGEVQHPVKIGLSDAYIFQQQIFCKLKSLNYDIFKFGN